ncbi:translational machinery component [Wilcoxina mikolae CBS 423.85]|nr:translational machinery component [Wilcoxina mikolae CBS 423.85]
MVSVATDLDPSSLGFDLFSLTSAPVQEDDYHLHIYSTKHNTHITFTKPDKGSIVSKSAGNLGFKKSQRGTYDAAYQLAAYVFKAIEDKNVRPRSVEVVLRGFGQGREAAVKALLGQEGKFLRPVVRRVTDSTRLKFGGTRSKKPRRLG